MTILLLIFMMSEMIKLWWMDYFAFGEGVRIKEVINID